jgi:hypothetical protein
MPSNRRPHPTQKTKAAGNLPPTTPRLSRKRDPAPVVVPFVRLPLRTWKLRPLTPRPRIPPTPLPPMFQTRFHTRSLTPSTLPRPAKRHDAPVAADVVVDAAEAEAVAANKPLRRPSLPKESHPRFCRKRTTLWNPPSLRPLLRLQCCLRRPGRPQPPP